MSRAVVTRGRMMADDEQRIQINAVFIEDEVDGADLVTSLFAARIISADDKGSITSGSTRVDRTRRLLEIIMLRGPLAYHELLLALEVQGYDHVAYRLRNTDLEQPTSRYGSLSPPTSKSVVHQRAVYAGTVAPQHSSRPISPFSALSLREVTLATARVAVPANISRQTASVDCDELFSSDGDDAQDSGVDNRIKQIEDKWFILSRRVTRVEDTCTRANEVPDEELQTVKDDLAYLKQETLEQVRELITENEHKDAIIKSLSLEVEDRKAKLAAAQVMIEQLEQRIVNLEIKNDQANENVRNLQSCVEQQEARAVADEKRHSQESQELWQKLQEHHRKVQERDAAILALQARDADKESRLQNQEDNLREQSLQLSENNKRLDQLCMLLHSKAQTGQLGPPNQSTKPNFCIGGNVAVNNILTSANNSTSRNTGNKNGCNRIHRSNSKDNKFCRQHKKFG